MDNRNEESVQFAESQELEFIIDDDEIGSNVVVEENITQTIREREIPVVLNIPIPEPVVQNIQPQVNIPVAVDQNIAVPAVSVQNPNHSLYQPFKKTNDLVVGQKYRVHNIRKVATQFGNRIRAYCDGFNYDMPVRFVAEYEGYNWASVNYSSVFLNYIGRESDAYR